MKDLTVSRKRVLILVACLVAAVAVSVVVYLLSAGDGKSGVVAEKGDMTVAVTPTLDCLPVYVAYESGIDEEMGCPLLLQEHKAVADCDTALAGGSAVCVATDSVRAESLLNKNKGKLGKQFSIVRNPNTYFYLFANRKARIKKAAQMKDKLIAVDRKGADALMAQYVLDSVKLNDGKAFLVNILSVPMRMSMLSNNTMDAAVLPEPQATVARKTGHEYLYSEGARNGRRYGAFLVKKDRKELFVEMYNRACDSINKNGIGHYDSILIKRMAVPEKFIKDIPVRRFVKL